MLVKVVLAKVTNDYGCTLVCCEDCLEIVLLANGHAVFIILDCYSLSDRAWLALDETSPLYAFIFH